MKGKNKKDYTLHPQNYKKAIQNGDDFFIQFSIFTKDVESMIIKIIHWQLAEYDLVYLKNTILTVVKELINNAVKANIKRVFFEKSNLDINNPGDYEKGMENFKLATFQDTDSDIYEKLEESSYHVRVSLKSDNEHIQVNIINNIAILDTELEKVKLRIKKAYKYNDISEAFEDVIDDSEGAGLGIVMAMLLFKNSGLKEDALKIYKEDGLTIASVSISKKLANTESSTKIIKSILKEIENIPAFPEKIKEIQSLCNDKKSSMKSIADIISLDPGLTVSILKLANSAGYVTDEKVDSIEDAVEIIGKEGINTLLIATGVHTIFDERYKKFQNIWQDSYRRAFYSQMFSVQLSQKKISDLAYLAALLCDIGRIIMLSIKPESMEKLITLSGKKYNDISFIEEISIGVSHSTLGGLICKKWKFNESVINTVELHHKPHLANEDLKQTIYTVYIADCFVDIENMKCRFEVIDEDVLDYFKIKDKKSFDKLHNIIKKAYESHILSLNKQ
ncbi:HDOD domain-containing protein [Spirochaetota bacterium]